LQEKLRRIETSYCRGRSETGPEIDENALEKMMTRVAHFTRIDPPIEIRFSLHEEWSRLLFLALARRYGFEPYRYKNQNIATVMIRIPRSFADGLLWSELQDMSHAIRSYQFQTTLDIIKNEIHPDLEEIKVLNQARPRGVVA
jgi:hypothetical protein